MNNRMREKAIDTEHRR